MKKQLLVIAALLIAASTASAQQKAGTFSVTPKVGVTVSNINGRMPVYVAYAVMPQVPEHEGTIYVPDSDPGKWGLISYENQKRKAGFTAGIEAQYQFTRLFGLSVGVFYTQQGAK